MRYRDLTTRDYNVYDSGRRMLQDISLKCAAHLGSHLLPSISSRFGRGDLGYGTMEGYRENSSAFSTRVAYRLRG